MLNEMTFIKEAVTRRNMSTARLAELVHTRQSILNNILAGRVQITARFRESFKSIFPELSNKIDEYRTLNRCPHCGFGGKINYKSKSVSCSICKVMVIRKTMPEAIGAWNNGHYVVSGGSPKDCAFCEGEGIMEGKKIVCTKCEAFMPSNNGRMVTDDYLIKLWDRRYDGCKNN